MKGSFWLSRERQSSNSDKKPQTFLSVTKESFKSLILDSHDLTMKNPRNLERVVARQKETTHL